MTPEQPTAPTHQLGYLLSASASSAAFSGHPCSPPARARARATKAFLPGTRAAGPPCARTICRRPWQERLAARPPRGARGSRAGRTRPPPLEAGHPHTLSQRLHDLTAYHNCNPMVNCTVTREGLSLRCVRQGEEPCPICSLQKSSTCYGARHTRINKSLMDE